MPLFAPAYKPFLHYHMPHHSYITIDLGEVNKAEMQRSSKKLPMYDPDLPTAFEAWLFSTNGVTRTCFLLLQALLYSIRPQIQSPRAFVLEDYIGFAVQCLYVWSACIWSNIGALVYLFCASILGQGLHVASVHFIAEHYSLTENTMYNNDPYKSQDTYSYYGPLNAVMYNGGYHIEHHDFPRIPFRNLPKLKALAPEYYDTLEYHMSYLEVLLCFIFRHPGLYQRIKREYKKED